LVEAPVQPARIDCGSICSLKVKVIVSPVSASPWLPPPAFPVEIAVAVGAVLSTATLYPVWSWA
jgi:hypothetical protein